MFWHNFKYTLKTMFRNKIMIFWTFAFPIILGSFFNMAFSNIENSERLDIIDIAIVKNSVFEDSMIYKNVFESLGDEKSEDRLFDITYTTEEESKKLLENDEIAGYLILKDKPEIVINSNGIDETILKVVVDEIVEYESIYELGVSDGMKKYDPSKMNLDEYYESILVKIERAIEESTANIEDISRSNLSYTMIEFYTLIAMTCLYGGALGMYAINQNLANMSDKGKRVAVSPTPKRTTILSSILASYVIQVMCVALLFLYTIFVLGVDYGPNTLYVISISLVGCLAGLSMGVFIATSFKSNEDTKTGLIIAFTMVGCFLAGMMGITMKYMVDKNFPILNKVNPAYMITDGLYSLYYYGVGSRFYLNLISILAFSVILIAISVVSLRRQTYDSI